MTDAGMAEEANIPREEWPPEVVELVRAARALILARNTRDALLVGNGSQKMREGADKILNRKFDAVTEAIAPFTTIKETDDAPRI